MLLIICREKSFVKEIGDIGFRENWCEKREKKKRRVSESDYVTDIVARGGCKKSVSLCSLLPVYPTDNLSVVD